MHVYDESYNGYWFSVFSLSPLFSLLSPLFFTFLSFLLSLLLQKWAIASATLFWTFVIQTKRKCCRHTVSSRRCTPQILAPRPSRRHPSLVATRMPHRRRQSQQRRRQRQWRLQQLTAAMAISLVQRKPPRSTRSQHALVAAAAAAARAARVARAPLAVAPSPSSAKGSHRRGMGIGKVVGHAQRCEGPNLGEAVRARAPRTVLRALARRA